MDMDAFVAKERLRLAWLLLFKSTSAASSASEAFGTAPTKSQKLVLEQRNAVVDAARMYAGMAEAAFYSHATLRLVESTIKEKQGRIANKLLKERQVAFSKAEKFLNLVRDSELTFHRTQAMSEVVEREAASEDPAVAAFLANENDVDKKKAFELAKAGSTEVEAACLDEEPSKEADAEFERKFASLGVENNASLRENPKVPKEPPQAEAKDAKWRPGVSKARVYSHPIYNGARGTATSSDDKAELSVEYLSLSKSAAASALRAFGSAPTVAQKLVSAQRISVVKAARSLVDAAQIGPTDEVLAKEKEFHAAMAELLAVEAGAAGDDETVAAFLDNEMQST